MNILYYAILTLCSSPLLPPTFNTTSQGYICMLWFSKPLNVKYYQIMEGPLDAKENNFTTVDKNDEFAGYTTDIKVDLNKIQSINPNSLYSICVTTNPDDEKWYSEPFRYSTEEKGFKLARRFPKESWYEKYKMYLIGGLILIGIGGLFMAARKYAKSKDHNEL